MGCYRQYPPNFFGSIAPVAATPNMTRPVGVRDGLLFTAPSDGLPEVTENDNGALATVVNGAWDKSKSIPNRLGTAEGDILSLQGDMLTVQQRLDEIYDGIIQLSLTLNAINRTVVN